MKRLHILRSEPGKLVRLLIEKLPRGPDDRQIPLYQGPVDYDRLVQEIFQSDRVICWW